MIRFFNARIITFDGDRKQNDRAVLEGELWTDGDKIRYVGPAREDRPVFEREIDLRGDLLIPGFKNAHTHTGMTFLRSFADDLPLQTWLFDKVFPLEAKLTPDAIYAFTRLGFLEYLANGITACFDMSYTRAPFVQAVIDTSFRSVICGCKTQYDEDLEETERCFEQYNGYHPLLSYRLGLHAEYTANEEMIRYLRSLVERYRAPFYIHNSETRTETEECIERHGCTPTAFFEREGLYQYGGGGFHCVWCSAEDRVIFRRNGLWTVTNPASNAKLASGVAPLTDLVAEGNLLALGTDGPASNNALDFFREMYLACVLQKLRCEDASAMSPEPVLDAACRGGALAMGLPECSCLAPGMQADLTVIDLHRPNMQPIHNLVKNLVYSGNPSNIRLTMIAGKILYENGEFFVGDSAEEIYASARRETEKLVKA